MISHDSRCIFIHIPRCAGTSIETWIVGADWWLIEPNTKHLLASQAQKIYSSYWDGYFKFAVVRNPYTRTKSCLKFGSHFGLKVKPEGGIDFDGYFALFGKRTTIEHDHRFTDRIDIIQDRSFSNSVYHNILDEQLDFVARYECLEEDMEHVRAITGMPIPFKHHVEQSSARLREYELNASDQAAVLSMYEHDFDRYGYSREYRDRFAAPGHSPEP